MKIHTLDPVWTQLDEEAADFLRNLLSYKVTRWENNFGKKKCIIEKEYLVQGWNYGEYMMLTGFVDRALAYLDKHGEKYNYVCDIDGVDYNKPHVNGDGEFRDYQLKLIMKALVHGYGTIIAPTGSGKSWVINGIISAYPDSNILLLVHTTDLVQQLQDGLVDAGFDPGEWSGKKKEMQRITVATVQAYANVAVKYGDHWDIVMVDEGHHVSSPNSGWYYKALAYCAAPGRFAFTATEADKEGQRVGLEGLIGPVVGELTMEEGKDLGFLAKAEIIFRVCPLPDILLLSKKLTYSEIYRYGIVENLNRTIRIVTEAEKEVSNGGTVLILVKHVRHTKEILKCANILMEVVQGSVKKEDRLNIKNAMKSGTIQCTIATTSWTEGIDIPNITMVINAGGGKSERETLQKIGRGLRKTDTKTKVKVIDFIDVIDTGSDPFSRQRKGYGSKHILHKQSISRWETYVNTGWEPIIK